MMESTLFYLTFCSQYTGCGKRENALERGRHGVDVENADCPW